MSFLHASRPSGQPFHRLPGTSSYLHGSEPKSWHAGIPQYASVRYAGLYDGVDLVYHSRNGKLEYDFVLAPGADGGKIAVQYGGVEKIALDAAGGLELTTASGVIRQHRPVAYQDQAGARHPVMANYELTGGVVRIRLGAYDRSQTLVIDPVLDYSSYFGGAGGSSIDDVKVDANGDVYMTGNAPPPFNANGGNPFIGSAQNPLDAFVMKFSPSRNAVLFFTSFGGSSFDGAQSLALDSAGNVIVGGYTISTDFPVKNAVHLRTKTIFLDGFVTKFAADGKSIVFSTYLGGDARDALQRVATDKDGNTYVIGSTTSQDFPSLNGLPARFTGYSLTSLAFLTKLGPTGAILYSGLYGGLAGNNEARGIALDPAGNIYLSGWTGASDFPVKNPLPGTSSTATAQQPAAWLAKVNPNGQSVAYSTLLTIGGSPSNATAVAVDALGSPTVAWLYQRTDSCPRRRSEYLRRRRNRWVCDENQCGRD